ncbi:tetratricopeptide repeat protein [Planctomicrobium sp. SH668]|uniref:tetratricopeptide repeat protein n=1 Tax=Planctomicrobium sp. SH668 TaxID=3448126 RepID=UPI003F5C5B58
MKILNLAGHHCIDRYFSCLCTFMLLLFAFPQGLMADPVTDYNVAVEFYKQQRWDLAADACAEFIEKNPSDERAVAMRIYWAQSLVHLRKFQEARVQFQLFLQQAPDHADRPLAMYRKGECSYFLNDYAAAEAELTEFLKAYDQHDLAEWAYVYLAESQLRLKKYEAAAANFDAAIKRFPNGRLTSDAYFGLAMTLEGLNRKPEALEMLQNLANRTDSPRSAEARFSLGARLFDERKFDQAYAEFQKLITQAPGHQLIPAARLNAGYALYYLAKYSEAIAELKQVPVESPLSSDATYWIALSQKSLGDFAAAAATISDGLQRLPPSDMAERMTFQLGDVQSRQGEPSKAIATFASIPEKWPNGDLADDAIQAACEVALQSGELTQAKALNDQFQKSYSSGGLSLMQELLMGRILIAEGDAAGTTTEAAKSAYEQARVVLKRVVETTTIERTKNIARFQLARISERLGEHSEVMAALKPIIDSQELNGTQELINAQILFANARMRSGDAVGALADYQKLLAQPLTEEDKLIGFTGLIKVIVESKKWDLLNAALDEFSKADPNDKQYSVAALRAGDQAFNQQIWSIAIACFERVIAKNEGKSSAYSAMSGVAHSQFELKEFQKSAESFGKLATSPGVDELLRSHATYMQALSLQHAGKAGEALNVFEAGVGSFSQASQTLPLTSDQAAIGLNAYRLAKAGARVSRELMQTVESDKLYEAAYRELKTQPESARTELDLLINEWADLNYNAKNFTRSDEIYTLLISECPASPLSDDARLILAESLRFGNQRDEALAAFQKLAELDNADDFVRQRALTHLLDLYAETENWEAVKQYSNQYIARFPNQSQSLYAKFRSGEADLKLKKYAESSAIFSQVSEEISQNFEKAPVWWAEVWLLLAESQFWLKDYATSEATIADLKKRAPDSPLLYRADSILGRGLENQAKFPEARAAYMRIINSEQSRGSEAAAEAQFRVAESFLKENNLQVALREYYKVYAGYKSLTYQPAALYQAAACDVSLKQFPQALDTYRKLIAEFPESEYAEMATRRIEEINAATGK